MGPTIKPAICSFWHPGTLTLRAERQSAWMSKIINGRLNPLCHSMLYSCTHMATLGIKGFNTVAPENLYSGFWNCHLLAWISIVVLNQVFRYFSEFFLCLSDYRDNIEALCKPRICRIVPICFLDRCCRRPINQPLVSFDFRVRTIVPSYYRIGR